MGSGFKFEECDEWKNICNRNKNEHIDVKWIGVVLKFVFSILQLLQEFLNIFLIIWIIFLSFVQDFPEIGN